MHKGNKRGTTKEGHNTSLQIDFKIDKMKKLILFAAIFAATSTQAQKVDTVRNAIQVIPKVFNAINNDTLYQVHISAFGIIVGDTTSGCNTYVTFYDRKRNKIGEKNVPIPASVVNKWGTDDSVIEEYVIKILNLIKK